MAHYTWKYSVKADAAKVGQELEVLYEEHGKVTPPIIVEDARNEERETHKLIEWDEAAAAEKYRLEQAKYIMRNIIVVTKTEEIPEEEPKIIKLRVYENVKTDEGDRYYMPLQSAMEREDTRSWLLAQALKDLMAFRRKYGQLKELAGVMEEIEKTERQYTNTVLAA